MPEGRIVTPRKIADARDAALSFLLPVAALIAVIVAADFSLSGPVRGCVTVVRVLFPPFFEVDFFGRFLASVLGVLTCRFTPVIFAGIVFTFCPFLAGSSFDGTGALAYMVYGGGGGGGCPGP